MSGGTIRIGHVLDVLATLSDASIHVIVTSPPYWGLRDYGTEPQTWLDGWVGHLGHEPTPDLYVEHLVTVFREVRRVLRPEGICWLNLGDSYVSTSTYKGSRSMHAENGWKDADRSPKSGRPTGLKPKDLVGMPWMAAFALRADGWWLRMDVVWSKPNPMPESVRDRPTRSHEYLFLLTKSEAYFYDAEAVREPTERQTSGIKQRFIASGGERARLNTHLGSSIPWTNDGRGRNLRSVWTVTPQPYKDAHFATFPERLVEPCILAGTSERGCCPECGAPWRRVVERQRLLDGETPVSGTFARPDEPFRIPPNGVGHWRYSTRTTERGWEPTCTHEAEPVPCTVLDPFAGSGTTLATADRLGRRSVGIELKPEYADLAVERIRKTRERTVKETARREVT